MCLHIVKRLHNKDSYPILGEVEELDVILIFEVPFNGKNNFDVIISSEVFLKRISIISTI